jgi:phosphoribosylaminoimidazolecarboxamide formyltransferase/IMP cyclohydrolase
LLVQEPDVRSETVADLQQVTVAAASAAELDDAVFAQRIAKHTRSNTIVFARNRQLLGSGTGQTSRVDALRQAAAKARAFGFSLDGAVMASDAFFPFADCVELAHGEGVRTVVQPGGSVRDADSVDFCDRNGMAMYLTGVRHFKH